MVRVYLDNAATTPLLGEVKDAMKDSMDLHFGNPSSIHHFGRITKTAIENARKSIAEKLECSISEIYFFSSATEASNLIINQCVQGLNVERIITSPLEHPCVLKAIEKEKSNCEVVYLDVDQEANLDLEQLSNYLENPCKTLVSLMYVNNELGTINPISSIYQMCQEHLALFHTDAVQAIGKVPVNLSHGGINFMTASAHKFHGPKGIGFAYINGNNNINPSILGGAQERNMRAGTENVIGICGMHKAFDLAIEHSLERMNYITSLKTKFKEGLLALDKNIKFLGDPQKTVPHILNVSFPASEFAEMIMFNLDINGICASAGSACSSGVEHESDVLQAIRHEKGRKAIRFSFSHLNTKEEIDYTLEKIKSFA